MRFFRQLLVPAGLLLLGLRLPAAETIPPIPPRYFNDYAGVVSPATAASLNARLEQFERDSSNQVIVAIYPRMDSDSSIEDYTVRVAQAWRVGQQKLNNGAVLFAFMREHSVYLQVGYGLEPSLTDATAKRIIDNEIVPHFRAGDYDAGMIAAVNAIMAASKGQYRGSGRTVANQEGPSGNGWLFILTITVVSLVLVIRIVRHGLRAQPVLLGNPGKRSWLDNQSWWTNSNWTITGGGSDWGGGGGGGGFSGGGGSFGGGGAGGSW